MKINDLRVDKPKKVKVGDFLVGVCQGERLYFAVTTNQYDGDYPYELLQLTPFEEEGFMEVIGIYEELDDIKLGEEIQTNTIYDVVLTDIIPASSVELTFKND